MRVAVHYNRSRAAADSLCAEHPGRAFAIQADLGTDDGCARLAREAVQKLGGAQVLVHSAGIWNDGPIATLSRPVLEEMFRVNTFSAFSLLRELVPSLQERGGSVVLIGSTAGQRGEAFHSHYAASKGALQSLTSSLAVELAPAVRVNIVSPGWIRTPM